jgi:hypothetical protein
MIVVRPAGAVGHLFLVTSSRRLQLTPEQREQQDDGKRNAQEPQQGASAKRHCKLLS